MRNFLVTTTPILDGIKITDYLGVVNANIVIGANFFSDFAASLTDFFGGRSGSYQNKMNEMYDSAIKELKRKTLQMGGNAIVSFNVDFDELAGKGKAMFMLNATGTACKADLKEVSKDSVDFKGAVSVEEVKKALDKQKMIDKFEKKYPLNEDDWNLMFNVPSVDYLDYIFQYFYPVYQLDNWTDKTNQLISLLPLEDVIPKVYKYYPKNHKLSQLVKDCNLFNPKSVLALLSSEDGIKLALDLLKADKDYYNKEDVDVMEQIINAFDNLPDKSTHTKGKMGMFGKETDITICPNGHKHSAEERYCPDCGCDDYGLTKWNRADIDAFKNKVQMIKKELANNN